MLKVLATMCILMHLWGCAAIDPTEATGHVVVADAKSIPSKGVIANRSLITFADGTAFLFVFETMRNSRNESGLRNKLVAWRYDGRRFSKQNEFAPDEDTIGLVDSAFAGCSLPNDKALVLWPVRQANTDPVVLKYSIFDGKKWLAPITAVRGVMPSYTIAPYKMVLGSLGGGTRVLVFTDRLTPAETYSIGIDNISPDKPFAMNWEDGRWGRPTPMMPRGRYDYKSLVLAEYGNKVYLLAMVERIHQFMHNVLSKSTLQIRCFNADATLSDAVQLPVDRVKHYSAAVDWAGRLHVVNRGSQGMRHWRWDGKSWTSTHIGSQTAVVGRDGKGRIVLYCQQPQAKDRRSGGAASLKIVHPDGETAEAECAVLSAVKIVPSADGAAYLMGTGMQSGDTMVYKISFVSSK